MHNTTLRPQGHFLFEEITNVNFPGWLDPRGKVTNEKPTYHLWKENPKGKDSWPKSRAPVSKKHILQVYRRKKFKYQGIIVGIF